MPEDLDEEYEKVISTYYGKDAVTAIVMIKVDTKEADAIARSVSEYENIEDVFLVTGDTDIIAKAHFQNYAGLKEFAIGDLGQISGIKDIRTMMVVSSYKHRGKVQND